MARGKVSALNGSGCNRQKQYAKHEKQDAKGTVETKTKGAVVRGGKHQQQSWGPRSKEMENK